jgi:hypothetical protein
MARARIEELIRLMDDGFEDGEFSLLANLATVDDASWSALPEGGHRRIRELTHHIGMFKFMYANHAFRCGDFAYEAPPASPSEDRLATPSAAVEWLREGHGYLTSAVAELEDDAELAVPRKAHWGALVPTEALLTIMVQHDLYHAGEINHARALLQDTDRWYIPGS